MALYRCSVKERLSRKKGDVVAKSVAYITRARLEDERTGEIYDYSRNKDLALWNGVYAPKNAPEWTHDLQTLVNEIERAEKRKDSQLALPVELSMAHELTLEQNRWMLQDFIKENFTRKGYATIASIHEPPQGGDPRNIHAHLLVTLRTIDEDGFAKHKKQQQENFMTRSERVEELRASWEKHLKHHLERHGHHEAAKEVSCKSLEAQGIDREPTKHLGPAATEMMRRGASTERGDANNEIKERNEERERLKAAENTLSEAIDQLQRQLEKEQQAERERRAQEFRERDASAKEAIRSAWTAASRDPISFMIELNERDLYVAQNEKGFYVAVERSGYAHRMPLHEMHEAIDVLKRQNKDLLLPTLEEQRAELAAQHEEKKQVWYDWNHRRAARLGATLYDRADMVSMQRDAMRHMRDAWRMQGRHTQEHEKQERQKRERELQEARRQKEQIARQQEALRQKEALARQQEVQRQKEELARQQEARRQREEQERHAAKQASRDPGTAKSSVIHTKPQEIEGETSQPRKQEPDRQHETLRQIAEADRQREALRQRQELARQQELQRQKEELAKQQALRQKEELARQQERQKKEREQQQTQEAPRDPREREKEARREQGDRLRDQIGERREQTEYRQRRAQQEETRERFSSNPRSSSGRSNEEEGREREKER